MQGRLTNTIQITYNNRSRLATHEQGEFTTGRVISHHDGNRFVYLRKGDESLRCESKNERRDI